VLHPRAITESGGIWLHIIVGEIRKEGLHVLALTVEVKRLKELLMYIAIRNWHFLVQLYANKSDNFVFTVCLLFVSVKYDTQTASVPRPQSSCCTAVITSSAQSVEFDSDIC